MLTPTTREISSSPPDPTHKVRNPPFPVLSDAQLVRLDVTGPRYTSYPTVPEWSAEFGDEAYRRALQQGARHADEPLSLYVHIPFCHEMCTYCGCNVIVTRDRTRADRYLDALEGELRLVAGELGARRKLARVHLGGGTPTFLDEAQLRRLLGIVRSELETLPDAELAVEIEPTVTSEAQLETLRALGFNRLSLGVQDFDPHVQEAVNRIQTVDETARMVDVARGIGFRSVNFDLIYGLPRQTQESWGRTLASVVGLRPDRIAAFSFAHVPSAKPHQRRLAVHELPGGRDKLGLFQLAYETLTDSGYRSIGFDHFALPGDELSVALDERRLWRDFQGYTVWRAADSIALGVSGISCIGGAYAQNLKSLAHHAQAIAEGRLPVDRGIALSADDEWRRAVIVQLMCNGWVDLGANLDTLPERAALSAIEDDGLVEIHGSELELTPLGHVFARNVCMVFDTYLGRSESKRTFSRTI